MSGQKIHHDSFWRTTARQFAKRPLGMAALIVLILFVLVGVYAPFIASSKPIVVYYDGQLYFPLFRYLFYRGFFTTRLDLFFNLLMFTLPLFILACYLRPSMRRIALPAIVVIHTALFLYVAFRQPQDPAADLHLARDRLRTLQSLAPQTNNPLFATQPFIPSWKFEVAHMDDYARLNAVLHYRLELQHHNALAGYEEVYSKQALHNWLEEAVRNKRLALLTGGTPADKIPSDQDLETLVLKDLTPQERVHIVALPTLWYVAEENKSTKIERLKKTIQDSSSKYFQAKHALNLLKEACQFEPAKEQGAWGPPSFCGDGDKLPPELKSRLAKMSQTITSYEQAQGSLQFIHDRDRWLEEQNNRISFMVMPVFRPFHWEDDAGGQQSLNQFLPWWELTRTDRKDFAAALVFGVRISIVVGITAVALALAIGIPVGCLAGYYAATTDIVVCRLMEVWEAMPTFFMLLLVVSVTQSKSIFLVIAIIGFFGWTGFSRYIRGEFFKQRNLPYVEACRAQGFNDSYVIFRHILPNAIPPLLTLLPFAIMGAITTEAGLSFLGLGEEGSCSWGVLMDEGRRAFPGESYLLWPPAILLTALLVAIALVGDALRDSIDPRLHKHG